jgi:hypothetical protein
MSSDRWATIERLYHEALSRPAEERAAFLADACAGDDALGATSSRCWRRTRLALRR